MNMLKLMNKEMILTCVSAVLLIGCDQKKSPEEDNQKLADKGNLSFSLEKIINDKRSSPFACGFGHFEVEIVPSKYKEHKYFKLSGSGILINSGWLHSNIGSNPDIIYAVPQSSPIKDKTSLSAYCISSKDVPYEGKERENLDQAAAIVEFAAIESDNNKKYIDSGGEGMNEENSHTSSGVINTNQ